MTRIDCTAGDLQDLLAPVVPHIGNDKHWPEYHVVQLSTRDGVASAMATDRVTLAATRLAVGNDVDDFTLTLAKEDVLNVLKVFKATKKSDPHLQLIIDEIPHPTGDGRGLALRVSSEGGQKLEIRDRTPTDVQRIYTSWRGILAQIVARPLTPARPVVSVSDFTLARWAKASAYDHPRFFLPENHDTVLVTAGESFIGLWRPRSSDAEPEALLKESAWLKGLEGVEHVDLREDLAAQDATPVPPEEDLVVRAAELMATSQFGSTAFLQRKLRVDFGTTSMVMDLLELYGVVGPRDGGNAREVLVKPDGLAEALDRVRSGEVTADAPAEAVEDDGTCGDCAEGRCHGGDPDDCGCDRHAASVDGEEA